MRVLGIDPGSETLGWGVVEGSGNKYSLVEFGTVALTATAFFKTSGKLLPRWKDRDAAAAELCR